MQLKVIDPNQKNLPTLPLLIKVEDALYETDCLPGLVAAVVGREYLDVRTTKAAWNMRVNAARRMAALLGGFGIPAIVRDEKNLLADNRVCPPEEQEEMDEIDWAERDPVVIWAHPDRAFIISLMEAGMSHVGEHPDSYILRYGPPWEGINSQKCGACQYFKIECGVYGGNKAKDSGTQCAAFVPRQAKKAKSKKAFAVKYIGLDGTVPLAEAAYIVDRKALTDIDALADFSRWWEE
ncbi:MAG: hypothetical protein A4E56_02251 [Pelotomaculum sp. PtaU1.Bin065]|nr:MAG: hypothetical protein A4E56_02251 [Pelotomaculum sp. PtaU1.Bin065]